MWIYVYLTDTANGSWRYSSKLLISGTWLTCLAVVTKLCDVGFNDGITLLKIYYHPLRYYQRNASGLGDIIVEDVIAFL